MAVERGSHRIRDFADAIAFLYVFAPFFNMPELPRPKGRPGRKPDLKCRKLNRAIRDVVDGYGDILANLSIITGLSKASIAFRIDRGRWDIPECKPDVPVLDKSERKYVINNYKNSKDPAILAFLASIASKPQSTPGSTTSTD